MHGTKKLVKLLAIELLTKKGALDLKNSSTESKVFVQVWSFNQPSFLKNGQAFVKLRSLRLLKIITNKDEASLNSELKPSKQQSILS
jgi:hypothetical protein